MTVSAIWEQIRDDDRFETMDNVVPRDVSFLWKPYLISGAVNLVEGDPGIGKTYLLCAIAAAISSGGPLPGRPSGDPANVLFMSAEDDPETTLVKRLSCMGADLSRISFPRKYFRLEEEALSWIEAHVVERKAKLLILDPLLAYMQGGIDMNKANETRPFMSRLRELAQATGCTMIGLRHLTKADNDKAIFRGLGSVDIAAAVRSIVQVGYHPETPRQLVMAHAKHNLSERGPSLLYSLVGVSNRDVPAVVWQGETHLTAGELGRPSAPPGRPNTAITDARMFVRQFLADGPRKARTSKRRRWPAVSVTRRCEERSRNSARSKAGSGGFAPPNRSDVADFRQNSPVGPFWRKAGRQGNGEGGGSIGRPRRISIRVSRRGQSLLRFGERLRSRRPCPRLTRDMLFAQGRVDLRLFSGEPE